MHQHQEGPPTHLSNTVVIAVVPLAGVGMADISCIVSGGQTCGEGSKHLITMDTEGDSPHTTCTKISHLSKNIIVQYNWLSISRYPG